MTPISIVFSSMTPSNPSLSVRSAVWIASSRERSSLYLRGGARCVSHCVSQPTRRSAKGGRASAWQEDEHGTHRFSRNVFALVWFLPIALAFHAQNEPEGSTWYSVWPRALSNPATRSETPNGRTPLRARGAGECQRALSTKKARQHE